MKILLAGADGQLGQDFHDWLNKTGSNVVAPDRQQMDLLQPQTAIDQVVSTRPDWVVNCAAYTQVDKAEEENDLAFRLNRDAARTLAQAAASVGARVLQVSTDYVFSGEKSEPYTEEDETCPIGVYGQSKLEGEQAVLGVAPDSLVVRTAWLYGAHGHNFVKTMLRLAKEREELRVVSDQFGTPTWTRDLAQAMWSLMQAGERGIFHYSNDGETSWCDFAKAILEEGLALGFPIKARTVTPITTSEYPTPAKRPAYSVLSKAKIRPFLKQAIPPWRQSLRRMLEELQQCPDC